MKNQNKHLWIWFLGIDGSGKTTQALLLSKRLKNINYNSEYIHLEGPPLFKYLLPRHYFFLRKFMPKVICDQKEKDTSYKNNFVVMLIWLFSSLLDSFIEAFVKIRILRKKSIIIQDRVFFQKIIYYLAMGSDWITKLYIKLFPKPDLIYYLNLHPALAAQRKKEDTIDSLKMQYEAYLKILKYMNVEYITIEANDSVENLHNFIFDITLNILLHKKCIN